MNVLIVGQPVAESDAAVARWLVEFLAREQPGTTWTADHPAAGGAVREPCETGANDRCR
jgi:hypothetical protein